MTEKARRRWINWGGTTVAFCVCAALGVYGYSRAPDDTWAWFAQMGVVLTWVFITLYLERRWKVSDRASVTHGPPRCAIADLRAGAVDRGMLLLLADAAAA